MGAMAQQPAAMNKFCICLLLWEKYLARQNHDLFPYREREGTPADILRLIDYSYDYRRGFHYAGGC